jgi:predicted dithiol-disulfide oxidoreductase (DUF899 family)
MAYKRSTDWMFTWASSLNSEFNYDFNTSFTEEQQRSGNLYYNYHKGGITSKSKGRMLDDKICNEFPKLLSDNNQYPEVHVGIAQ